ncbi:MAG TPA: SAM-dependent chlorinase/fluorinase, partial [Actinomycetota bacterium]|nr:SAM-dependent chlorinase/fluorinase [Actinomycetota bacterium]
MAGYDWITFTSDYGLEDNFVGVCHGVMARVAPRARVIDVSHGVGAQDVRQGALVLEQAVPFLPRAVHLAVVDPGVGSGRGMVAVEAGGQLLVG